MIGYLSGEVIAVESDSCLLVVGGVGYQVYLPQRYLQELAAGMSYRCYTWLNVREDALQLYGFADRDEYSIFRQIIAVSGVGPKAAMAILSTLTSRQFVRAVVNQDAGQLLRVPGIGKKTAQRLLLELKDCYSETGAAAGCDPAAGAEANSPGEGDELIAVLRSLGYSTAEIAGVIPRLDGSSVISERVRQALRLLAR